MRRFGAGLAALALGAALSGCWLQPGFDAGNTNANTGEATITAANVDLLDEQWSAEVGDAPVESLLALGSRVFTGGGVAGVPSVFGLQAATGAPLWTATPETDPSLPPPTASDPVHVDGHLEVAWSLGAFGGRTTIDPATGQELSNTGGPGRGGTHTLAVVDGETAAGVRAQHQAFPGQVLTAVDWRCDARSIDPLGGPTGGSTFAFVGDALAWSHGTRALGYRDCDPGSATWATTWATELGGTPTGVTAVGTGAVAYVDDTGTLSVLDAATGAIRWTTEVGPGASRATVAGGRILVATPDARLVAYAADTGSPVWQATLPAAGGRPVVGGDVAAVAVGTDVLAFPLDGCGAATCPALATLAVGSEVTGGPIVDGGRLLVGTADARVVAFGLPT